ncbi:hypothetical protein [Novosphingopyxis sp.]|uniref:hypothetical protein n=1 Tax=Novosphingopyxis sp. TaxID=2709690 RepID=UPI003B5D05A0
MRKHDLAVLSLLLVAACSQAEPEASDGGESPVAEAAAPALQPTKPVEASIPSPTPPAQPGKDNLCAPGEPVIFSCRLASGKSLSVCAAAEAGGPRFAQYRYGASGEANELTFPENRAAGALRFVSVPYSGGGEAQLSFARGSASYVVYSRVMRTNFEADEPNDPRFDDGVLVLRGEKTIADHRCESEQLTSVDHDLAKKYAKSDDSGDVVYHD